MANNDKLKKQDTAAPSIAEHKKFQKTLLDTLQENNVTDTHIHYGLISYGLCKKLIQRFYIQIYLLQY